MMPQIKLHYIAGACSLAPHILLHEINAQFTLQEEPKDFTPEFLALNPEAKVPVLVLDNVVITESIAVLTAISSLAPDLHLMGEPGSQEATRILEWMSWLATALHVTGLAIYFRPFRFTASNNPDALDDLKKVALENVRNCFRKIEDKLSGVHAVENRFTALDVYLYFFHRRGLLIWGPDAVKRDFPKYSALAEAVAGRKATIQALQEEGL